MNDKPKPVLTQKPGSAPVLEHPAATPAQRAPAAEPFTYKSISALRSREPVIRSVVFGPAKSGKTTLLGTFPGVAIADYDGDGVEAMANAYFLRAYPHKEDIYYQTFIDELDEYGVFKIMDTAKMAFMRSIKWLNSALKDSKVHSLGIDSLTTMSLAGRNAGLIASGNRNRSQTLTKSKADHLLLMTQADYGAEMNAVEQMLNQLMAVRDKHILVTAHERTETNDAGMIIARTVLITGDRLRAQLGRWFADMWYLDTDKQGKRTLVCQPKGVLKGVGSRLGMPAELENPSFDSIMRELTKHRKSISRTQEKLERETATVDPRVLKELS